jgi:hypothetical protein
MPKQYPPDLLGFLVSQGVSRVIVGHTPHGNCPTVIPHEGLTVIMGDTSPLPHGRLFKVIQGYHAKASHQAVVAG